MSFEKEPQSIIINAENVYFLNITPEEFAKMQMAVKPMDKSENTDIPKASDLPSNVYPFPVKKENKKENSVDGNDKSSKITDIDILLSELYGLPTSAASSISSTSAPSVSVKPSNKNKKGKFIIFDFGDTERR
mgnify:CR=1 FL=1